MFVVRARFKITHDVHFNIDDFLQHTRERVTPFANMETPHTTHLTDADYSAHVYEPAEDSFLLLDALEAELPALRALHPTICVEIGPGSGVIVAALARALATNAQCFGVDINPHACRCTRETVRRHGCRVEVIGADLLSAWRPGSVDVLVFNPPYVVTPDAEVTAPEGGMIARAWAGGASGRMVTDRFLGQLNEWLTPKGCAYVVLIKENDPVGIGRELLRLGFVARVIAERKIRGERLFVMKVVRSG